MRIKSDASFHWMMFFCLMCIFSLCAILFFCLQAPFLYVLLIFLLPTLLFIFPLWYAGGQTLIMSQEGIEIKFLFLSRFFSWNDLKMIRYEAYKRANYKSPYQEAVIFSRNVIHKPTWMKPLEYCFFSPYSFSSVHFLPLNSSLYTDKINGYPLVHCVDKDEFFHLMNNWNIKIENGPSEEAKSM